MSNIDENKAGNNTRSESGTKPFILIADTAPHIVNHLAGIFELANFEVMIATSAQECIDVFMGIKDKVDIILMNGSIAGDEGIHVIISVRREKPNQRILVVVEEENARSKAMEVGADVVLLKPITAETILLKVNDMLLETESFLERKRAKFQRRM
jgi:DNA-binding response OmpR family regulator